MQIRRAKFSENFKRKVVAAVLSGQVSKETARRVYDIRGKSAVTDWVRFYGSAFDKNATAEVVLPDMTRQEREHMQELQRQIVVLQEHLEKEKHRAGLYRTMIEMAEQQLNIPIRKKYGARQWRNTKPKSK